MANKMELLTLHKYFLNASLMKSNFDKLLQPMSDNSPEDNPERWSYLSLWYGCLRVVIEGWSDLRLSDTLVDPLLDAEKIRLLNGFRNDTFHYKPDYISDRTLRLIEDREFVAWIRRVHDPLGSSILRQLREAR